MASLSFAIFLSISLCLILQISPAHSQICKSQKFDTNKLYANCSDLPTLNATLHYTYNASNSSLSIAFMAKPAKPDGWVGWAVNLNGTGMAGAQALVAMKSNASSILVKKYNIISYRQINETTRLAVDVWDVSAESSSGSYVIFANVKVPENMTKLNQIWQVGPSVTNGFPDKHEFAQANLLSRGVLDVVASSTTGNTTNGGANNTSSSPDSSNGAAGYKMKEINVGCQAGLLLVLGCFLSFW